MATLNCFGAVPEPFRFTGVYARASRFGEAVYASMGTTFDVLCLQEAICCRDVILSGLKHHPYHTPVMGGSLFASNMKFLQSGLCIVSKYPIQSIKALIFDGPTYHLERLVSKGVLYARIAIPTVGNVHIFNTHLNAWSGAQADDARSHQMQQITDWIRKLSLPATELVVVAGDFNIDMYEHNDVMQAFMQRLGAKLHLPRETSFSFDPAKNELVGLDDPQEYQTKSQKHGCYEDFLLTKTCTCCPRQLVDGICSLVTLLQVNADVQVVRVKTNVPFQIDAGLGVKRDVFDVTDHGAVLANFSFPFPALPSMLPAEVKTHTRFIEYENGQASWVWILVNIIMTSCFFLLFFLVFWFIGHWSVS